MMTEEEAQMMYRRTMMAGYALAGVMALAAVAVWLGFR